MATLGIGLDIGAHSAKVVVGQLKRDIFYPITAGRLPRSGDGDLDLAPFLNALGVKGEAVMGVTGKDMIIRYTQAPPMPDWQLKQVMGFEVQDLASQSGGGLSADFNRLDIVSSLSEDDTVLLTLIKDEYLDDSMAQLSGSKVACSGFTPNAIALYNLFARTADVDTGTSMIVDLGADNIDIAIVQDGALIFARNIFGGANLFDQAIMDSFNLPKASAEKVKREMGCVISPSGPANLKSQQEKVGKCLTTIAGRIHSMIQSSIMFCKAQIKVTDLSLDKVFLTGGGARLRGLDAYLSDNLRVPVEHYDPADIFDITSIKEPGDFAEHSMEFSSAFGLALMASGADHYSIQVLPEAVKKQQFFKKHTVFGILAALLLFAFLGFKFYLAMEDAAILEKDIRKVRRMVKTKKANAQEILRLNEENTDLVNKLNVLDDKVIPLTGLVRTFALIQKYLPGDLWITNIEIDREEREEFNLGDKKLPVIKVKGSGKEMGQPLQKSFTDFRSKLDADPLTQHVIPQVRYDNFSFTLTINYSCFPGAEKDEEEGDEEELDEG